MRIRHEQSKKMGSHKGTKITKKTYAEDSSFVIFVAS